MDLRTFDAELLSQQAINEFLCTSCKVGSAQLTDLFLKLGADVHFDDELALNYAVTNNYIDCASNLLSYGAKPKVNFLCTAVKHNYEKMVELLLSDNTLLAAKDINKIYFHLSTTDKNLYTKYVSLFIKKGIMPSADSVGAAIIDNMEDATSIMIDALEKLDADSFTVSMKDEILSRAAFSKNYELVDKLLQKWPSTTGYAAFFASIQKGGYPIFQLIYQKRQISDNIMKEWVMSSQVTFTQYGVTVNDSLLYYMKNSYQEDKEEKVKFITFFLEHGANIYHLAFFAILVGDEKLKSALKAKLSSAPPTGDPWLRLFLKDHEMIRS